MTYGDKTYHQYHDQYVPPDSENMMYANGGGIGSMMIPKRGLVNEPGGYAGEQFTSGQNISPGTDVKGNVRNDNPFTGGGGDGPPSVINPHLKIRHRK